MLQVQFLSSSAHEFVNEFALLALSTSSLQSSCDVLQTFDMKIDSLSDVLIIIWCVGIG